MQDCRRTYGGAIRWLEVETLTPERFVAAARGGLAPPPQAAPFVAGLHTVSACGELTLVDVKRSERSARALWTALRPSTRVKRE
jgi:hypothetical protein